MVLIGAENLRNGDTVDFLLLAAVGIHVFNRLRSLLRSISRGRSGGTDDRDRGTDDGDEESDRIVGSGEAILSPQHRRSPAAEAELERQEELVDRRKRDEP